MVLAAPVQTLRQRVKAKIQARCHVEPTTAEEPPTQEVSSALQSVVPDGAVVEPLDLPDYMHQGVENGAATVVMPTSLVPPRRKRGRQRKASTGQVPTPVVDSNWIASWSVEEIRGKQKANPEIKFLIEQLEALSDRPTWSEVSHMGPEFKAYWTQWDSLDVDDGVLYHIALRVVSAGMVPPGSALRQIVAPWAIRREIFKQLHDHRSVGHRGVTKTIGHVRRRFYWPSHKTDIENWCHRCSTCAQCK